MTKKLSRPTEKTNMQVYIQCARKCSYKGCGEHLTKDGVLIGEIAHIHSLNKGARFNLDLSPEQRNHPDNLIAMCRKHHKMIDSDESKYSAKLLFQWKKEIEQWAEGINPNKEMDAMLLFLISLDIELDKNQCKSVMKSLKSVTASIKKLNIPLLTLEYELLDAKTLALIENISEAQKNYESLSKRFPDDIRSLLRLAEIYLNKAEYEKNIEYLSQAEKIDKNHPLILMQKLLRAFRCDEDIVSYITAIDESSFPEDERQKSDMYRLYALLFTRQNDYKKAEEFIEKSIHENPLKVANYLGKLFILDQKLLKNRTINEKWNQERLAFWEEIDSCKEKIEAQGGILTTRNEIEILGRKANFFYSQVLQGNNVEEFVKVSNEIFSKIPECCLGIFVTDISTSLLAMGDIEESIFLSFLDYLKSQNDTPLELQKSILPHCLLNDTRKQAGEEFFTQCGNSELIKILEAVEKQDSTIILKFLNNDFRAIVHFLGFLNKYPNLREQMIMGIDDDDPVDKKRLLFRHFFGQKDFEKAFEFAEEIGLENITPFDCDAFSQVYHHKEMWDKSAICLEKWLEFFPPDPLRLKISLQLFQCKFELEDFKNIPILGEEILRNHQESIGNNATPVLGQMVQAHLTRGEYKEAIAKLEKYPDIEKNIEFLVFIEAETYIRNGDGKKAQEVILRALCESPILPTPEQYVALYKKIIQLESLLSAKICPLPSIQENCFFKLKDEAVWRYIGAEYPLDAEKVKNSDKTIFLDKKIGEKIVFDTDKYSSSSPDRTIQNILPIEQYIHIRAMECFFEFAKMGNKGVVEIVEPEGKPVDFNNLKEFMKDIELQKKPLLKMYSEQPIPLAFLAVNEGSFENALAQISEENHTFIRFSNGSILDFESQKAVAESILEGEKVYLDGTSALFLSEYGVLGKIEQHFRNLVVPQSVISMLLRIREKFEGKPASSGTLGLRGGKLHYSEITKKTAERIQKNIKESILILEEKKYVQGLSKGSKCSAFTEKDVPPELSDACILAQRNGEDAIVLTEDPLYLQANALDTKKKCPESCSSLMFMQVLWEKGLITYDEYLDYFGYLSSYRFHLLPVGTDDLWRAIFGDGNISTVIPEKLRKLNLRLILSEEYGVPIKTSFGIVASFLLKIIQDDSITMEVSEKIFAEIICSFLADKERKIMGRVIVQISEKALNEIEDKKVIITPNARQKLRILAEKIRIYSYEYDPLFDSSPILLANTYRLGMEGINAFNKLQGHQLRLE